ncbi:MAG: HAD hydrolase family protein, partial [Desulfurococcaceae archaeon]
SAKDCWFLKKNVPHFIHGLSCINGGEVIASGYIILDESLINSSLSCAFKELMEESSRLGIKVEIKRSILGYIGGLSLNWRDLGSRPAEIENLIVKAESYGLYVVDHPNLWFVDFYASRRNKGDSVRILKALLGVDKVVYFGDSHNDIPAFRESNISVLVEHNYNRDFNPLYIKYRVRLEELARWLWSVSAFVA